MFYSQDILQRRGGKFGIIWIAATRGDRLTKREYCNVNVTRTCEDIIRYITLQVVPLPGGSRPRLSLYLASQLMFGTVAVFDKQHEYLFLEALCLSKRFHRMPGAEKAIELNAPPKSELLSPTDIEAFLACDFEFGSLRLPKVVQPHEIPMTDFWKIPSSPSSPRGDIPFPTAQTPVLPFQPEIGSPHQVSHESITMKESPLPDIVIPQMLDEQELPPPTEEGEQAIMEDVFLPEGATTDVSAQDIDNQMLSPADKTPPPIPDTEIQFWEPADNLPASPGVTPIMADHPHPRRKRRPSTTMVLSPITPSPVQRKRRRQLLFADRETQIDRKQLKLNMLNGAATCSPMVLPDIHCSTVEHLFSLPSRRMASSRLIHLWKRNTITREVGETDSERAVPSWTVPELGESTSSESERSSPVSRSMPQQLPILSPVVEREEMMGDATGMSFASIEQVMRVSRDEPQFGDVTVASMSSRDSSAFIRHRSSANLTGSSFVLETPERADLGEPGREVHMTTEELGVLHELVEELEPIRSPKMPPDGMSPDPTLKSQHKLLRIVNSLTSHETWTTFKQVCPLTSTRCGAAQTFTALLDLCTQQKVQAKQNAFYEDIFVARGHRW